MPLPGAGRFRYLAPVIDPVDTASRKFTRMMAMLLDFTVHFVIAGVLARSGPGAFQRSRNTRRSSPVPSAKGESDQKGRMKWHRLIQHQELGLTKPPKRSRLMPAPGPLESHSSRQIGHPVSRSTSQRYEKAQSFPGTAESSRKVLTPPPVVVIEIGDVLAVRGIAQNGPESPPIVVGVKAAMATRGGIAGIDYCEYSVGRAFVGEGSNRALSPRGRSIPMSTWMRPA